MANKGTLVRNKRHPEWGAGVVVTRPVDGKVEVLFEDDGSRRKFRGADLPTFCECDIQDVPSESPLRDAARWNEVETLPPEYNLEQEASDTRACTNCSKPLRDSQYSTDGDLKSCPNCSRSDGKVHVYYPTPDAFGTTHQACECQEPRRSAEPLRGLSQRRSHAKKRTCDEVR